LTRRSVTVLHRYGREERKRERERETERERERRGEREKERLAQLVG
jgi:hypothetical protein